MRSTGRRSTSGPGRPGNVRDMSRWVAVGPERLAGWIDRFAAAHGGVVESTVDPTGAPVPFSVRTQTVCAFPYSSSGE